jgi:hypothetical protein
MYAYFAEESRQQQSVWQLERRGVENVAPLHLLVRNVVAGAGMLFDAQLAREYPEIPEAFDYHDHWYAFVAACNAGVYPIPEPLYYYRQHSQNVLGITSYPGLFGKLPPFPQLPRLLKRKWGETRARYEAARRVGVRLDQLSERCLGARDRGAFLFSEGLKVLATDPALARACFARAGGKALARG